MGQGLPTPPKAPAKNLGAPFKGGDRVLDRNEIVDERGFGKNARGVTLREERDSAKPKDYQERTSRMIANPSSTITDRGVGRDTPVSERFERLPPPARPPERRRSTRSVSGRRR